MFERVGTDEENEDEITQRIVAQGQSREEPRTWSVLNPRSLDNQSIAL